MPGTRKVKVFVSYSRHDEALVKPLASLIGIGSENIVFLDVEQLKPGDLWDDELIAAIRQSSVFVLCWCCKSEHSEFVQKEIAVALEGRRKKIVPVLFCSTPLPSKLSKWQWIDLRGRITHECEHTTASKDMRSEREAREAAAARKAIGLMFMYSSAAAALCALEELFLGSKSYLPILQIISFVAVISVIFIFHPDTRELIEPRTAGGGGFEWSGPKEAEILEKRVEHYFKTLRS